MYTITIKNLSDSSETTIYESDDTSKFIEKPSLSLEWQQPGSLSFTIIPGHPSYDDIKPIITFVYVYRDNEEIFFGRVLTVDRELFGKKDVYCEGALSFLSDGQLLHSCDQTMTVANFLTWCMNEMIGNSSNPDTIEARKQFIVGDVDSSLASQSAYFKTEEYAEPKNTLDEHLINRFGGCFVIRKEMRPGVYSPSGHSINYLKTVGNVSSEKIRICENVRDRTDHDSGESIFTILRPIGANTGGDNGEPCKLSTNGGVIEIPAMIAKYGRICKTENFSDQDTESGLLTAAQAYITRLGMSNDNLPKTCDIKFVDFHYLNPQIATIGFGDVFTDIEGYENQTMVVGHLELDLENPANDSLSLYNQTYLDAREYSALLESSTGAASTKNSASGGGGSAIAKTLAGAAKTADDKTTEIESHFKHVTSETNRELHDNFGIIGVKLDPNTHLPMKDASGNYIWAGPEDEQAEIWGNFQRSAWETIIENVTKDGRGNVLSIGQVSTLADGQVFVDAINDSRTGTAKINADRLKINTTSGSSFSIDENGNIVLDANNTLTNINNTATLTLSASRIDIDGVVNALSTRNLTALNVTVASAITAGSLWLRHQESQSSPVQTSSVLDHYHQLNCDAQGNVTAGAAVWSQPTSNFNIANTQFYQRGVEAARAQGQSDAASQLTTLETSLNGVFTAPFGYSQVTVSVVPHLEIWDYNNSEWIPLVNGFDHTILAGSWQSLRCYAGNTYIDGYIRATVGDPIQMFYSEQSIAEGKAKAQFYDSSTETYVYLERNISVVGEAAYNNM